MQGRSLQSGGQRTSVPGSKCQLRGNIEHWVEWNVDFGSLLFLLWTCLIVFTVVNWAERRAQSSAAMSDSHQAQAGAFISASGSGGQIPVPHRTTLPVSPWDQEISGRIQSCMSMGLVLGLVCQQMFLLFADLCSAIRPPNLHSGSTMRLEPYWCSTGWKGEQRLSSGHPPGSLWGTKTQKIHKCHIPSLVVLETQRLRQTVKGHWWSVESKGWHLNCADRSVVSAMPEQTDVHSHESVKNNEVFEVERQKSSEGGRPA